MSSTHQNAIDDSLVVASIAVPPPAATPAIPSSSSASATGAMGGFSGRCADCPARDVCMRLHHQSSSNTNNNNGIISDSNKFSDRIIGETIARIAVDDDIEDSNGNNSAAIIPKRSILLPTSSSLLPDEPSRLVRRRSAPRPQSSQSSTDSPTLMTTSTDSVSPNLNIISNTPTNGSPLCTAIIPPQTPLPAIVLPSPSHNSTVSTTISSSAPPSPRPSPSSVRHANISTTAAAPRTIPRRPLTNKDLIKIEWTWEEIKQHASATDCWLVAHNIVYDATTFLDHHPAGSRTILRKGGTDVSQDFDFHSPPAQKKWRPLAIGIVAGTKPSCIRAKCVIM